MSVQLGAMKSTHHKTMLEPTELSPRQFTPLLPILTVETHNQDSAVGRLELHAVIRQQTGTRIKPRLPKTKRTSSSRHHSSLYKPGEKSTLIKTHFLAYKNQNTPPFTAYQSPSSVLRRLISTPVAPNTITGIPKPLRPSLLSTFSLSDMFHCISQSCNQESHPHVSKLFTHPNQTTSPTYHPSPYRPKNPHTPFPRTQIPLTQKHYHILLPSSAYHPPSPILPALTSHHSHNVLLEPLPPVQPLRAALLPHPRHTSPPPRSHRLHAPRRPLRPPTRRSPQAALWSPLRAMCGHLQRRCDGYR